jgi:hypothetical protein
MTHVKINQIKIEIENTKKLYEEKLLLLHRSYDEQFFLLKKSNDEEISEMQIKLNKEIESSKYVEMIASSQYNNTIESHQTNKRNIYAKNVPWSIIPLSMAQFSDPLKIKIPQGSLFFGYEISNYAMVRWSLSKKTFCAVLELYKIPDMNFFVEQRKDYPSLSVTFASKTVNVIKEERAKKLEEIQAKQDIIFREEEAKLSEIANKISSSYTNRGRCCVCHNNRNKNTNCIMGQKFLTCCPGANPQCLATFESLFKQNGIRMDYDFHTDCDKYYFPDIH